MTLPAVLYQIQRTRLISNAEFSYYRFDLVNSLTYACVCSGYSRKPIPPKRLRDRQDQLNATTTFLCKS